MDLTKIRAFLDSQATVAVTSDDIQQAAYRPTLVVGLGGTGTRIVQKLRRKIRARFGDIRSQAYQFAVLDTDAQDNVSDDERLDASVYRNLAVPFIPVTNIIRNMAGYGLQTHLRDWWPHYRFRPPQDGGHEEEWLANGEAGLNRGDGADGAQGAPEYVRVPYEPVNGDISEGAHAVRAVGRFALWQQGRDVRNQLLGRWGIAAQAGPNYGPEDRTRTGKIYVVCSLSGGTGSGMFLDVAYTLRRELANAGMPIFFTGILLMDAAPFRPYMESTDREQRMNANIYAALTELNHLQAPKHMHEAAARYAFTYNGGWLVESQNRPFDVAYLIGMTNQQGRPLPDLNAICDMVSQGIFLEIASPLSKSGRSALDNVEELHNTFAFPMGDWRSIYVPKAFSSFAVASLNYWPEKVAQCGALRLLRDKMTLVTEKSGGEQQTYELAQASREVVEKMVAALEQPLRQAVSEQMRQFRQQRPDLGFTVPVDGESALLLINEARGIVQAEIRGRLRPLTNEVKNTWRALVSSLFARPGGITGAADFLKQAVALLGQRAQDVDSRAGVVQIELQTITDELQRNYREYQATAKLRGRGVAKERQDALAIQAREIVSQIPAKVEEWLLLDQGVAIIRALIPELDNWREAIEAGLRSWTLREQEHADREIARLQGQLGANAYSVNLDVLTSDGYDNVVNSLKDKIEEALVGKAIDDYLEEFRSAVPRGNNNKPVENAPTLAYILYQAILQKVREQKFYETWDLFEAILEAEVRPLKPNATLDDAIDRALNRLREYGVPFWRLDHSLWSEASSLARINLLGYHQTKDESGQTARWVQRAEQVLGQITPVLHNVRNQLVLLQTEHGAPAYLVTAATSDKGDAYKKAMQRWRAAEPNNPVSPVHLQDNWSHGEGLIPLDPRPQIQIQGQPWQIDMQVPRAHQAAPNGHQGQPQAPGQAQPIQPIQPIQQDGL